MADLFNILIDILEEMKNDGISTIPIGNENFEFLEKDLVQPTDSLEYEKLRGKKSPFASANSYQNQQVIFDQLPSVSQKKISNKREHWENLRRRVLENEDLKKHVRPEKKLVFGVGNLDAKIFFCGEAPGADEEIQGIPFVGRAGQLLTKIIAAMGLSREDVYIGNIMNWRPEMDTPTGNRPPRQDEMQFCLPYLIEQLQIVQPKVIIALGATAVSGLLGYDRNRKMSSVRGKWHEFCGIPLMITFHPSYLLRNGTNRMKRVVWEDMLNVMDKIGMPISEKQRKYFLEN